MGRKTEMVGKRRKGIIKERENLLRENLSISDRTKACSLSVAGGFLY